MHILVWGGKGSVGVYLCKSACFGIHAWPSTVGNRDFSVFDINILLKCKQGVNSLSSTIEKESTLI